MYFLSAKSHFCWLVAPFLRICFPYWMLHIFTLMLQALISINPNRELRPLSMISRKKHHREFDSRGPSETPRMGHVCCLKKTKPDLFYGLWISNLLLKVLTFKVTGLWWIHLSPDAPFKSKFLDIISPACLTMEHLPPWQWSFSHQNLQDFPASYVWWHHRGESSNILINSIPELFLPDHITSYNCKYILNYIYI